MRIFILGTGRCGSVSFIEACHYMVNYTAGHEEQISFLSEERFSYPENHIESDNRLSWHTAQLDQRYESNVFYVHLKRDRIKTAMSFNKRFYGKNSIITSYSEGFKNTSPKHISPEERLGICIDYVDAVHANVDYFLKNKKNSMIIELENIKEGFDEFWKRIGAEGDLEEALAVFDIKHNVSAKNRKRAYEIIPYYKLVKKWNKFIGGFQR